MNRTICPLVTSSLGPEVAVAVTDGHPVVGQTVDLGPEDVHLGHVREHHVVGGVAHTRRRRSGALGFDFSSSAAAGAAPTAKSEAIKALTASSAQPER